MEKEPTNKSDKPKPVYDVAAARFRDILSSCTHEEIVRRYDGYEDLMEALGMAIETLEKYNEIGTVKVCKEAMAKAEEKKE